MSLASGPRNNRLRKLINGRLFLGARRTFFERSSVALSATAVVVGTVK